MEGIPSGKGTLNIAENRLKSIAKQREHLETERAKFAGRVVKAHEEHEYSEFKDLETIAHAAELESMNADIERLKKEEEELRTLLDRAQAA